MTVSKCAALVAAFSLTTTALAAPIGLYPIQMGAEVQRYQRGVPTVSLEQAAGAVLVTPLAFDHGGVSLGLAIYNKGNGAANFGIENIHAFINDEPVAIFTREQLESKAKNRAMWTAIGIAVVAGAAAGVASTAHTNYHYHSVTTTPIGTFTHAATWRDNSPGVIGASAATAAGVAGIVGVQNRLDYTLANLASDIVQTTTIDPDGSYGGRVVLGRPKGPLPAAYDVKLIVSWNGAEYPFAFRVTEAGKNMPAPFASSPAMLPVASKPPLAPAPIVPVNVAARAPAIRPAVETTIAPAVKPRRLPHEDVIEVAM